MEEKFSWNFNDDSYVESIFYMNGYDIFLLKVNTVKLYLVLGVGDSMMPIKPYNGI